MKTSLNRSFGFVAAALTVVSLWTPQLARAADPTTADCLAASEASLKFGNQHQLRAERAQLLLCSASSCPADIRRECLRRVEEANAAIPTIVFEAKDSNGQDLSAVKVTLDGALLAARLEGTALSIDPGEHTFTFETSGQAPVRKKFVIREAQKERHEMITFNPAADASARPPAANVAPAPASDTRSDPGGQNGSGLGAQRSIAIAAGAVGVVGLGLGSAFGLSAMSKKSDAHGACANACSDQSGVNEWHDAKTAARVADVFFVIGAVGLATGAVLWLTAKPRPEAQAHAELGLGVGEVRFRGVW